MSFRSIASVLAECAIRNRHDACNFRDRSDIYHDALGVVGNKEKYMDQGRQLIGRLKPHGYDDWLSKMDRPLVETAVSVLSRLMIVLKQGNEPGVRLLSDILNLERDSEAFWRATTGLELWGGSGSLFDQAFVDNRADTKLLRDEYYLLMFDLSWLIEQCGHANRFTRSASMVLRELVWQRKRAV